MSHPEAEWEDRRERTRAGIADRAKRTEAEIEDRRRRTEAEMRSLEADSRTTQRERTFFMWVTAFGVALTVGLTALGVGRSDPTYFFGPGPGLLLAAGGALRLRSLASRPHVKGKGAARNGEPPEPGR